MNHLNKKQKIILGILISIIGIVIFCYTYATETTDENQIENILEIPEQNQTNKTEQEKEENIYIHIAGCVQKEGLLELKSNNRIADAIEKAGGLTENADLSEINLACILEDGMKIYIPNKNEQKGTIQEEQTTKENANIAKQQTTKTTQKVNINTATQSQLETLPGIGPTTASKILEYRKEKGKFTEKEQIKEVSGIGEAKYKKIEEYITIK